jgi:hypothetical protein
MAPLWHQRGPDRAPLPTFAGFALPADGPGEPLFMTKILKKSDYLVCLYFS